jgi:hypothetical protein
MKQNQRARTRLLRMKAVVAGADDQSFGNLPKERAIDGM